MPNIDKENLLINVKNNRLPKRALETNKIADFNDQKSLIIIITFDEILTKNTIN